MISEVNIIRLLLHSDAYKQLVFGNLKAAYFNNDHCKEIFDLIDGYYKKFARIPTDNIEVLIFNNPWKQEADLIKEKINIVKCEEQSYSSEDIECHIKDTEVWIKKERFRIFGQESVKNYVSANKNIDFNTLNKSLQDIMAFTFDDDPWIDMSDHKYMIDTFSKEDKEMFIQFDNKFLNEMLGGGLKKKNLILIMAGTNVGKTRLMHSLACSLAKRSKKNTILYITIEDPKNDLALYTDSNYLNLTTDAVTELIRRDADEYMRKKDDVNEKYAKFIIKEYSTDIARPSVFRALLDELITRELKPAAVFVDYLNNLRPDGNTNNMYEKLGLASNQLRSISQEYEIPFISAAQPKREGMQKNKAGGKGADLTDIGESMALSNNCDLLLNIIETDEMFEQGRQMYYVLKSRGYKDAKGCCLMAEVVKDMYKVEITGVHHTRGQKEENPVQQNNSVNDFISSPSTPEFSPLQTF
jgi:replicative DNA helicase